MFSSLSPMLMLLETVVALFKQGKEVSTSSSGLLKQACIETFKRANVCLAKWKPQLAEVEDLVVLSEVMFEFC